MKSKNYILQQIKEILIDKKSYSEDRADQYIEGIKNKTVYELLVEKKELSIQEDEYRDVSCRTSIWHEEEY
jgi:hypothetical protein|tara:strand:+ start:2138 stop:2350 length:213 start_codon:yes stop_codon:yes gene_type:complete